MAKILPKLDAKWAQLLCIHVLAANEHIHLVSQADNESFHLSGSTFLIKSSTPPTQRVYQKINSRVITAAGARKFFAYCDNTHHNRSCSSIVHTPPKLANNFFYTCIKPVGELSLLFYDGEITLAGIKMLYRMCVCATPL